jgi:hypothetical protein
MTCHAANVGDEEPGFGAGDGFLPILGHSTAASKPCEGALYDPSAARQWFAFKPREGAGDDFEASGRVGTLDDLDCPFADFVQGISQLWPAVAAIYRREGAKTWRNKGITLTMDFSRPGAPSLARQAMLASLRGAILYIGTMNGEADQQTDGIGHNVTLATLDPFAHCPATHACMCERGHHSRNPLHFQWF